MSEEIEHVVRPSLPWRDEHLTECGLDAFKYRSITRDAVAAKVKKQGQQRAALSTCMTCWGTSLRWPPWNENPVLMIQRETHRFTSGNVSGSGFEAELRAIAALVEAHREEFDGFLSGLNDTTRLADRRQQHRTGGRRA